MAQGVGYRTDVQGLRGVAVLIVVLFHAGLGFPGGFVGVDVFFVISGFVIGRGLIAEAGSSGRVSLRQFYVRRVRRLLPALAVMLTLCSLAVVVVMSPVFPQPNALETARAANLSVSNLYLYAFGGGYFNTVESHNPFLHTWSLGVEEQFYLVFPVVVAACWWIARRRRIGQSGAGGSTIFVLVVVLGAALSLVCSIAWTYDLGVLGSMLPKPERFAFYGPISRIWEFMAGVGVALLARRWRGPSSAPVASVVGLAGLALIAYSSLAFSEATPFPGVAAGIPVAGSVLAIVAAGGVAATILEVRPLVWLGDRSYGWYLWHWPAIVLVPLALPDLPAAAPLAAIAALLPAALSYRFLETRYQLRRGQSPRGTTPRLAALSVGVPLVVIAIALVGANKGWGLEDHPEVAVESVSQRARCYEPTTPLEACTFPATSSVGTIMVVGDSHADVVSDVIVESGNAMGYDVIVQSALGCAFVSRPMQFDPDCVERQQQILASVEDVRPELLVIANNTPDAISKLSGGNAGNDVRRPADGMIEEWQEALDLTLTDVAAHTDRGMLVSTVPLYTSTEFDSVLPTLLRPDGSNVQMSVEEVEEWRRPFLVAESEAIAGSPLDVVVADPIPAVCVDGICSLRRADGLMMYRDGGHLTNEIARQLGSVLDPALRSAIG